MICLNKVPILFGFKDHLAKGFFVGFYVDDELFFTRKYLHILIWGYYAIVLVFYIIHTSALVLYWLLHYYFIGVNFSPLAGIAF